MVSIAKLTPTQIKMCDAMWSCATLDDVDTYITSLPTPQEQQEAKTMKMLLLIEMCDVDIINQDDCYLANDILEKFKK